MYYIFEVCISSFEGNQHSCVPLYYRSSSFERFKNRERETHFRPPDRRD